MAQLNKTQEAVQRSHYGKIEYWERRYSENTKQFDWYQTYDGIKDIVSQYITSSSRILNIGCGNSTLSEDMYKENYMNITNCDYSNTVISSMQAQYLGYAESFKYEVADVRELPYLDESFDCVIDKGLIDSVLCSEYSSQNSKKILSQIHRVLTAKGVYIIISYGQPKYRLPYLEKVNKFDWAITNYKVYKPNVISSSLNFNVNDPDNYHYIYVCRRVFQQINIINYNQQGVQSNGPSQMQNFPK